MRIPRRGALLIAALALAAASPSPALAAPISAEDAARCAAIASGETRLACYDALAGRSDPNHAPRAVPAAAPAAAAARATPPAVSPAAAAIAAPKIASPPAPPPAAPPDPAEAAQNFGLSSAQLHSAPGLQSIEAHVTQVTVDRGLRNFVVLDNGQTWASTDGGLQLDSGEAVTIKKAALGSFMLVSAISKHSYHVRRVR